MGKNKLVVIFYSCASLTLVAFLMQTTCFSIFSIPTGSMLPTLRPGDKVLVNKSIMGARIFNVWKAAEGMKVEIYRLPGIGKVKRNDVLVFHNPYPYGGDSLSMHLLKYYIKRCIALPGDTIGIKRGHYYIKNVNEPIGDIQAQSRIEKLSVDNFSEFVMDAYPYDKYMNWTIQNFGPLYVPIKGQKVAIDSIAVKVYRKLIEWEQKKTLRWVKSDVFLGDSLIMDYCFLENYYFMSGDNLEISNDSRYWGLVPESYIVGVATRIWKSVDKATGKIRWNRVMKKIE